MKAAVLYEVDTPLKVEDVDLDSPRSGEVRVRIVANGVCPSDYSIIHGVLRWLALGYLFVYDCAFAPAPALPVKSRTLSPWG